MQNLDILGLCLIVTGTAVDIPEDPADPRLEKLKTAIVPLLRQKLKLDKRAITQSNAIMWGGLGFLTAQVMSLTTNERIFISLPNIQSEIHFTNYVKFPEF